MDISDLKIGARKFGQLGKMASAVGVALFRVEFAIIQAALYCTSTPSIGRKLIEAQQLLQEVEDEIAAARKADEKQ